MLRLPEGWPDLRRTIALAPSNKEKGPAAGRLEAGTGSLAENIILYSRAFYLFIPPPWPESDDGIAHELVDVWMDSPGRWANILYRRHVTTGIGVATTYSKVYATQDFRWVGRFVAPPAQRES